MSDVPSVEPVPGSVRVLALVLAMAVGTVTDYLAIRLGVTLTLDVFTV